VLGLLSPHRFLAGEMILDTAAAHNTISELAQEFEVSPEELALGIHNLANAKMAGLIREMTVNKGRDPREFSLVSFGGAGGQHAYGVAEMVGCTSVFFPPQSSVFSALGLVTSDLQTTEAQAFLRSLANVSSHELEDAFQELEQRIERNFRADATGVQTTTLRQATIRYSGQTHGVPVHVNAGDDGTSLYERFQDRHFELYGTRLDDPGELVTLHATVIAADGETKHADSARALRDSDPPLADLNPLERRFLHLVGADVNIYASASMPTGTSLDGPCLVEGFDTTIVVPPAATFTVVAADGTARLNLNQLGDSHGRQ
jgi:N-methylhydantoinase A